MIGWGVAHVTNSTIMIGVTRRAGSEHRPTIQTRPGVTFLASRRKRDFVRAFQMNAFGSATATENNFPRRVILIVVSSVGTLATRGIARGVPLQQTLKSVLFHLPSRILLGHKHAKKLHLAHKHILIVAQRAFKEVARRVGQPLDTIQVIPPLTTRSPQAFIGLAHDLQTHPANGLIRALSRKLALLSRSMFSAKRGKIIAELQAIAVFTGARQMKRLATRFIPTA